MPEPVVSLRAVTKSVREGRSQRTILGGVDLEVRGGETVAIVGRSGSGKSTLLHLIAGLDRADSGSIALCGRDLGALDEKARSGKVTSVDSERERQAAARVISCRE
jgi:predicted ABC-type transport system involved in lysophospholipase L1 biosynthesis ATPase subunit